MRKFFFATAIIIFVVSSCSQSGRREGHLYVATLEDNGDKILEQSQLLSSVLCDDYDLWALLDEDTSYVWLHEAGDWVRVEKTRLKALQSAESFFQGYWYVLHGGDTALCQSSLYVIPDSVPNMYFIVDLVYGDSILLTPISFPYNEDGDMIEYHRIDSLPQLSYRWRDELTIKQDHFCFE